MSGPLDGIRVLDLSAMLSGPWAADILGDQGADVIKVEPPGSGDHVRALRNRSRGLASMFININRSKRSVTLNLKHPDGVATLKSLVATADVLIQNFRPGVVERLGISFEDLKQVNPGLVYLSISGFGESGPYANRRVYDPVVQALSGLTTVQAGSDHERPRLIRTVLPDKLTAMQGSQAICAALVSRGRTGEGQHIRLSMLDTMLQFLWATDMNAYTFADSPVEPEKAASFIDLIYETADGYITVSTMKDAEWRNFCTAAERPDLLADDRFDSAAKRDENVNERLAEIQKVLHTKPASEWLEILPAHDVPCAPALRRYELLDHPQVLASETIIETQHPVAGRLRQARPAPRFTGTPVDLPRGAPLLGQHNEEVLASLGLSAEEIDQLVGAGVVGNEHRDLQPEETEPEPASPVTADAVQTRGVNEWRPLIVGADRGIANAMALHQHGRGDEVIAACMGDGADLVDAGVTVQSGVDVTSDDAVSALRKRLEQDGTRLSRLVHVAGIMHLDTIDTVDLDDVRLQFEVNTIGPLRTVRELRGLLDEGAKVGILTSRVGSLGDNTSGGDYAYRISKAAANMVALNLHHDLSKRGVMVQALHPGMVRTHLLDVIDPDQIEKYASAFATPEQAAERLVGVLDALTPADAGRFQHADGTVLPW